MASAADVQLHGDQGTEPCGVCQFLQPRVDFVPGVHEAVGAPETTRRDDRQRNDSTRQTCTLRQ